MDTNEEIEFHILERKNVEVPKQKKYISEKRRKSMLTDENDLLAVVIRSKLKSKVQKIRFKTFQINIL